MLIEAVSLLYARQFVSDLDEILSELDYPPDSVHLAVARLAGLNVRYPSGRRKPTVTGEKLIRNLGSQRTETEALWVRGK